MEDPANIALGRIAAIERVMAVIIATHPAAEALAAAWRQCAPGLREDLHVEFSEDPAFLLAALAAVDRFDRHIQRVHAATAQDDVAGGH